MIGYSVEEVADRDAGEMFASERTTTHSATRPSPRSRRARSTKRRLPVPRRDGSLFWARVRASAVQPGRREAGTIWIIEDVSETRQARRELQALMNNASLAIMFTHEQRMRRCNAGFLEMFGYGPGECEGLPVQRCIRAPRPSSASSARLSLVRRGPYLRGRARTGEEGRHPDLGKVIGYPVNPDDLSQGFVWIAEDRTRQRRDEQALRVALQENQAIFDTAVLGIAVVENGHTLHATARWKSCSATRRAR
jgi:PAS domain S-box-containing protein